MLAVYLPWDGRRARLRNEIPHNDTRVKPQSLDTVCEPTKESQSIGSILRIECAAKYSRLLLIITYPTCGQ